jgi:hypothetical protein
MFLLEFQPLASLPLRTDLRHLPHRIAPVPLPRHTAPVPLRRHRLFANPVRCRCRSNTLLPYLSGRRAFSSPLPLQPRDPQVRAFSLGHDP